MTDANQRVQSNQSCQSGYGALSAFSCLDPLPMIIPKLSQSFDSTNGVLWETDWDEMDLHPDHKGPHWDETCLYLDPIFFSEF